MINTINNTINNNINTNITTITTNIINYNAINQSEKYTNKYEQIDYLQDTLKI